VLLETEGLEKRYGERLALAGLTVSIPDGRVGLLGPNGAGKSTLLKTMLGLVDATAGSCRVLGLDARRHGMRIRARVGYMPEGDSIVPDLSALDFVTFAAELSGLPAVDARNRAHAVLGYVGLGEVRTRRLSTYSTGMVQRAKLAQALAGDPELLLLDEPTSGLDPKGREDLLALLEDVARRTGASLLLSTHLLADVERLCNQVVLLRDGTTVYAGDLLPLVGVQKGVFEVRTREDPTALEKALAHDGLTVTREGLALHVVVPGDDPDSIFLAAERCGSEIRHLAPLVQTLERAFVQAMSAPGKA
jgi:ABC-2 type transport system ATP-binding protein